MDLALVIGTEAQYLEKTTGLSMLQLSGPVLAQKKLDADSAELVNQAVSEVRKCFGGKLMLHTFFYDFSTALTWILDIDVNVLGLDLTVTRVKSLKQYDVDRTIYLGVLDSRNSYLEKVEEIVSATLNFQEIVEPPAIHLGTSADLDFLPRSVADKKVEVLGLAYKRLMEHE